MTESNKQYHVWVRVHGPDLQPKHAELAKENQKILKSEHFCNVCEAAGIKPTKRQASKYRCKKGLAYIYGKNQ